MRSGWIRCGRHCGDDLRYRHNRAAPMSQPKLMSIGHELGTNVAGSTSAGPRFAAHEVPPDKALRVFVTVLPVAAQRELKALRCDLAP